MTTQEKNQMRREFAAQFMSVILDWEEWRDALVLQDIAQAVAADAVLLADELIDALERAESEVEG